MDRVSKPVPDPSLHRDKPNDRPELEVNVPGMFVLIVPGTKELSAYPHHIASFFNSYLVTVAHSHR